MLDVVRRNPEFRRLWLSQVVSQMGDWISRMAVLQLIANLSDPGHVIGIGALYAGEIATRLLPTSVMGPLAGPIADRLPRRMVMITADLLRAVIVLGLLFVREPGDLPLLYGLVVLQMSTSIFFDAARSASVPNTVPRDDLHAAAALSALTWSVMLSVGAALGGTLVSVTGISGVFVIDALSYLVSAAFLIGLRLPDPPRQSRPFRVRDVLMLREMREGLAHARELSILPTIFAKALWGGAGGFLVLLSVSGKERFATSPVDPGQIARTVGLLYAMRGLGTGLGPVLARRFHGSGEHQLRTQVTAGFALGVGGYGFFALCDTLAPALFFVFLAHCGGSTLWVASTTLWQRKVDDRFRGRIFALEFLSMTLAFSIGGFCSGLVFDRTASIPFATWTACLLAAIGGLIWMHTSRNLPLEHDHGTA